jgi:hypothetical protein
LLDLAYDLGKRLMPAFSTPTGLPYARVRLAPEPSFHSANFQQVNLRHGVMKGETWETCTYKRLSFDTCMQCSHLKQVLRVPVPCCWSLAP